MNNEDYKLKHKADVFREGLQSLLKKYNPTHYAVIVSNIINEVFVNRKHMGRYPIHFLMHSIQANCSYYNSNRNDILTEIKLQRILNHYRQYFDPVAEYFLTKDDGVEPFFVNMARQQLSLQWGHSTNSLGRSILLFNKSNYPKSEKYFKDTFNMTFHDWFLIGFAIYAYIADNKPKIISPLYYINSKQKIASDLAINSFFQQNFVTPTDVKDFNNQIENKIGSTFVLFYETYLRGVFVDKPMLRINETDYLVIHQELFMSRAAEGIFDICKKGLPSDFGMEFGHNFERYIVNLLREFVSPEQIYAENQLRQYTQKKICDVMMVFEDYIFLIECKGIEYSAYIATENSMKSDNSSKKISTGFDQLCSTAQMIKEGIFNQLIGDQQHKKIISAVITYKQLYLANSEWYYVNNIEPNMKSEQIDFKKCFQFKPQILSVHELELLLKYSQEKSENYFEIFNNRLENANYFLMGDWYRYLEIENTTIPFLKEAFLSFTDEALSKLKG
ncbi:hypothetical protein ACFPVX_10495 [Cohnella faecalis]